MASVLAIGTAAANSADIVLAADTMATFALRDAAGPDIAADALVLIQKKGSNAEYNTFAKLDGRTPVLNLLMNGTIRLSRVAGGSCGVDQD